MKKILLLIFFLALLFGSANSQTKWNKKGIKIPQPVCYASDEVHRVFVPPSSEILNQLKSGTEKKSDIIVNYNLFPSEAKKAFEYAVGLWELIIDSPIPIYVQANWRTLDQNVLGNCGPADYYTNFSDAPKADRYYPVAVAEKIMKEEITGASAPDINADFNKTINWYYGIDGQTPDSLYDFVSVVLHEMAHGLGFTGFYYITGDSGSYAYFNLGDATSFDRLVADKNKNSLLDTLLYPNPSVKLEQAFTSNQLFAKSPVAIIDGGGNTPRLYAPTTWSDGSSIYHLNDATYGPGNPNSLMTHAFGKGEAIHDPGPITNGIMADMGWKNMWLKFTPVKDIEQIKPLTFNVEIESDYEIDTTSLYVVLSTDSFNTHPDTVSLEPADTPNVFTGEYLPAAGTEKIEYYMNAGDKKNRIFKLPTEAPEKFFTVTIGPDNIAPTIEHDPISYYILNGRNLKVTAKIDDNLGVDTAYVTYSINGAKQPPFGLQLDSGIVYSANFNFDKSTLKDGDIISYNIIARDSSIAQNTKQIPFKFTFDFNVEGIFPATVKYLNDFDNPTNDFVLTDFDIYTAHGFDNGALQSPHPYPSPEENRTNLNFSTILKQPIILQEGGTMSYDEVVLVEPGESLAKYGDENFWDYVIVEGSKDSANTWLPLVDGYDSGLKIAWKTAYNSDITGQESKAIGTPDLYATHEFGLLENGNFAAGDTILIRFRLFSDPFANGWGWAIDNLQIQYSVSAPLTVLSPGNISVFPNPFKETFSLTVQPQNPVSNVQIDIFNMYGQKIKTVLMSDIYGFIQKEISLKEAATGIYFIAVKENGLPVYSKKIIKN